MATINTSNDLRIIPPIARVSRPVPARVSQQIKTAVHQELIRRMDLEKISQMHENRASQQQLLVVILQLIDEQKIPLSLRERDGLAQEVLDEVFGLGPLEPLLKDPTVNDILVNTYNSVYVERRGVLEKTSVIFQDNQHLMQIIDRIVSAVGRRVDESSPMVDARLKDGSRVNVIIPPLAVDGPILSIRKFSAKPLSAQDLVHPTYAPNAGELRSSPPQHHRLWRHGFRKDDAPERPFCFHSRG
jgi:pilus assembly protein CpaF